MEHLYVKVCARYSLNKVTYNIGAHENVSYSWAQINTEIYIKWDKFMKEKKSVVQKGKVNTLI